MTASMKIVSGVLQKVDKVLLCLRKNTEFYPGYWAFPVGRVEVGENFVDALRRELFEEVAIQMLNCESLTTLYDHEQNIQHMVYRVTEWRGEVQNLEPDLCDAVGWFSLDKLPTPITPATLNILKSL